MKWFAIAWLVLLVLFLLAEASTVTMVSLWFAAGALAALIAALLGAELWLQAGLFAVVSAALLLLLRPIARKYFSPRIIRTNADALIGTTGRITVAVDNDSSEGQLRQGGMDWTARSTSGEIIEVGTLVKIDRIEGVKVYVTPVDETKKQIKED